MKEGFCVCLSAGENKRVLVQACRISKFLCVFIFPFTVMYSTCLFSSLSTCSYSSSTVRGCKDVGLARNYGNKVFNGILRKGFIFIQLTIRELEISVAQEEKGNYWVSIAQ